ncbi:MAG: hypothetical protein LAQ69_39405, partial [Acidobacteriia bacterium]|nr:hypothetical protein [Terriglobia bacterium]
HPATRTATGAKAAATAMAVLYVFLVLPRAVTGSEWNYRLTLRARNLVEGVARAHELHPGKTILLDGVDIDQFRNGVSDHPFKAIGIENVYLTPGSERNIGVTPQWADIDEFVMPAEAAAKALAESEAVVYDVRGPELRNITSAYAGISHEGKAPLRVDVSSPLTAYLLGPEWYPNDGNHRWMPKRASLRMGGPTAPGQRLYLHGYCPPELLQDGPILVTVAVDSSTLAPAVIRSGDNTFELYWPLPDAALGKPEMQVSVEVSRTFRPPTDARDLGLAFGAFEVR